MGYESKVYVCARTEHNCWIYNEVVAAIDMCKMPYDKGWRELFTQRLDGDFLGFDHKNEFSVECERPQGYFDAYDEPMKYAPIDKVIAWLRKQIENGEDYRRITILYNLLISFNWSNWVTDRTSLIVVHYGY